jgi:P pilus assembly chaperone PapD
MNMRHLKLTVVLTFCFIQTVLAQTTEGDSTLSKSPVTSEAPSSKVPSSNTADTPDSLFKEMGVSVTPSRLNFNLKPGATKTYEIKVTNDTKQDNSFRVTVKDFDMDNKGRSIFMKPGESKHSLSKWMNVSPTFFKLKPGEVQKVKVTVSVPDGEENNRAAWSVIFVEQAKEREKLDAAGSGNSIALGVIPTFAFGVYVYQNPPTVKINKVEIKNFKIIKDTSSIKKMDIVLTNSGDGIAQCTAYIELSNLNTGKQQKLSVKRFTILPGYTRNYIFNLPENLEKGKYSAVGVLDFGSKEEIEAAELEFIIE